ncbi:MAG: Maf family protein [Thiotrichaceae bacterium]
MRASDLPELILASASPRRRELLDQIGIRYHVSPVDIDESALPDESAETLVKRLAQEKAEAAWLQQRNKNPDINLPVLGADTLGVLDSQLLVKPRDYDHAYQMLSAMSGNCHEILTAVAIRHQHGCEVSLNVNTVYFKTLTDKEISTYWNSGEPKDKAGAYAIQGMGAVFIKRIEGSYSGVMGLPLYETQELLNKVDSYVNSSKMGTNNNEC